MTLEHNLKSAQIDLINLKKNIWNFFPNHNKEFDETLKEALICKSKYIEALDDYNIHLKRLKEYTTDSDYKNFKDNFIPLFLFSQLASMPVSAFLFLAKDIPYFYSHISVSLVFIAIFFLLLTKNIKSLVKEQIPKIVSSEEKLHEIENTYKKTIKKFVKNGQELNVREHLEHYYHTDIPELNLIIQDILEKAFEKDFVLTNNVGDNIKPFDIEKTDYIKEITQYIDKVIDYKIQAVIANKMLSAYPNLES